MASPVIRQVGNALIQGIDGVTIDAFATMLPQSSRANHKFDRSDVKDGNGQDANLSSRNEMIEANWEIIPSGASTAAAKAVCVFLAPLAVVVIASHPIAHFNGRWIYIGDAGITITNVKEASYTLPLRKYVDNAQNTSLTTPVA